MPLRDLGEVGFPLDETTGFEFAGGAGLAAGITCLTLDDLGGAHAESAAR